MSVRNLLPIVAPARDWVRRDAPGLRARRRARSPSRRPRRTTTTTTAVPQLRAWRHRHVADGRGPRVGDGVHVPVCDAAVRRRSAVHRGVEFRRWRGRAPGPSRLTCLRRRRATSRRRRRSPTAGDRRAGVTLPVSVRSVTGRWIVTFAGIALKPEAIDLVQNQTAVTATINETATTGSRPAPAASPIRDRCRSARPSRADAGAIRRHLRRHARRHVDDVDRNGDRLRRLSVRVHRDAAIDRRLQHHSVAPVRTLARLHSCVVSGFSRTSRVRLKADTADYGTASVIAAPADCRRQNRTASGSRQSPRRTRSTARSRRFPCGTWSRCCSSTFQKLRSLGLAGMVRSMLMTRCSPQLYDAITSSPDACASVE